MFLHLFNVFDLFRCLINGFWVTFLDICYDFVILLSCLHFFKDVCVCCLMFLTIYFFNGFKAFFSCFLRFQMLSRFYLTFYDLFEC
jgi:hypothetical protein